MIVNFLIILENEAIKVAHKKRLKDKHIEETSAKELKTARTSPLIFLPPEEVSFCFKY